jgi:hypothetical protein
MRPLRARFTMMDMICGVAFVGIALFFLKSLVTFLNAPFLEGDLIESVLAIPEFLIRTLFCASSSWLVLVLRRLLRGSASRA